MPTYVYACTACAERLEAVQRFSDDPLTECPACGGTLRKVFSPVGVVFKGSGFYKTDSRGSSGSGKPADKPADKPATATSDSGSSSTTSDSGSSSAPAPAKPASSTGSEAAAS